MVVYLHLYARTDTGEVGPVARWEGEGPVTTTYVRDALGPTCTFTIKLVIDLAGMAPVEGYEVPDAHGHLYLVDHTGTRKLGQAAPDDALRYRHRHPSPPTPTSTSPTSDATPADPASPAQSGTPGSARTLS